MPRIRFAILAALALVLAACTTAASPSPDESEPTTPSSAASSPSEGAASPTAEESEEPETAEERVRIDNSQFDPGELTIAVGTEVVFLNADSFTHTVTEGTDGDVVDDPIVDDEIEQNGSVRVVFDEPGTYEITCEIHPSMQMTITVEG